MAKKVAKKVSKLKRKPVRVIREASKKPIKKILKDLRKEYAQSMKSVNKGVAEVNQLSDLDCSAHTRVFFSTGSLELDRLLTPPWSEQGGLPGGRVTEIYGPEHMGKSTLLDHIFAAAQRAGAETVLIETDAGRDQFYTSNIGVDISKLEYIEFKEVGHVNLENALDVINHTVSFWREQAKDVPVVIGFDALGVTPTAEEVSKTVSEGSMASAAKILRRECRKLAGLLSGTKIAVVIINHEYQKIGPFGGKATYGGDGIRLLASLRLKLRWVKDSVIKNTDGLQVGKKVGIELVKWKLGGSGGQVAEVVVINGVGIDNVWTVWDRLSRKKIIVTSGSWSAVNIDGQETKFQGFFGLRNKCLENPELFEKLVLAYKGTFNASI